jgi:hypothetical protein
MSAELTIKYVVDSIEGNSLSTIITGPNHGWVEYCNQRGQLFYADAVNQDLYKQYHQQTIEIITKYAMEESKKHLGFMNHLSNILINDEFVMPMFGVVPLGSVQPKITTGTTRLIASMMNGRTARDLKTVMFVPKGQTLTQLENVKPLTSTENFEKIYNLEDIDYEISMSDSPAGDMSEFQFNRSILKYSIYDKKDQALPHTQVGANLLNFWGKHVKRNKIHLNIRCTPEVEKLLQPSKIFTWDVVHEKAEEWQWSYGKILGAYRKTENPLGHEESQIHLWLYDATEPVYLELLFPWMTGQYTCCHTKNKKALFFDTSSDVTSMQVVGDWCK